jgi:hypothetical protein
MGLGVYLKLLTENGEPEEEEVYSSHITHNLSRMAIEAGLYNYLWKPETIPVKRAAELVSVLRAGLERLVENKDYYQQFNSPNGWGIYDDFVEFVIKYLTACTEHPDALISVYR